MVDISLKKLSTKSTLTCAAAVCHSCFIFVEEKTLLILLPSFQLVSYFQDHKIFYPFLVPHHGSSRCLCCAPRGCVSLYKGNKFEKEYILPEHAFFLVYIFWKRNHLDIKSHTGTARQYCSYILGFYPCFVRGPTCRGIIYNLKAKQCSRDNIRHFISYAFRWFSLQASHFCLAAFLFQTFCSVCVCASACANMVLQCLSLHCNSMVPRPSTTQIG